MHRTNQNLLVENLLLWKPTALGYDNADICVATKQSEILEIGHLRYKYYIQRDKKR
jgi:hypothetical protein